MNLKIYTVKERQPKNGESILIFGSKESFCVSYFDIKFVTVEYTWLELDENQQETGNEVCYTEGEDLSNIIDEIDGEKITYKLVWAGNGKILGDDVKYATQDDVEKLLE